MILTVARGSRGHYMVDEDGHVYTAKYFRVDPEGMRGPLPGERPGPFPHTNALGRRYSQLSGPYVSSFWARTGQEPEQLGRTQRADLAYARGQRDRLIEIAEETADRIAELDEERADLLRAVR